MGRYSKPIDLYNAQRKRFAELKADRTSGFSELAKAGLQDAQDLTAGELSPSVTRGAFARERAEGGKINANGARRNLTARQMANRGLGGQVPLLPINMQSHQLHDSMRLIPVAGRGLMSFDVTQEDPGGGIFRISPGGTRYMVDSGFSVELRKRWRARNKAYIDHVRMMQRRF